METLAHQRLKRLAKRFLRHVGCPAAAQEVRCPISKYRVDVAGYLDTIPVWIRHPPELTEMIPPNIAGLYVKLPHSQSGFRCEPRTVMIECKQSRADFLRDNRQVEKLLTLRADLEGIRQSIEEHQVKRFEPQLRKEGSSLFPELDEWNFQESRLPSYRKIMRRLRRVEGQLYGETKFHMIARYQLADRLYIAAPRGMIHFAELPVGWGLLECPRECLESGSDNNLFDEPPRLEVKFDAAELTAQEKYRSRLLRNIAVAASFAAEEKSTPRLDEDQGKVASSMRMSRASSSC